MLTGLKLSTSLVHVCNINLHMPKSILLIYNPASGYFLEKQEDNPEAFFREQLSEHRQTCQLTFFKLESDPSSLLSEQLNELQPDEIWVAGGDGTVLSVAQSSVNTGIPIGIIPFGTMNLMARDLGMSLDVKVAIKQLCHASISKIDMAELNGAPFLCISNIGMSTRLTEERERLRHTSGWIRWPLMAGYMIRFMFAYPTQSVHIKLGNQVHTLQTRSISISNNLLEPNSSLIPQRKQLDKGCLGVYVAKHTSIWSLPRLIFRLLRKDWQSDKDILMFKADHVRIQLSKPRRKVKIMTDGELNEHSLPLDYHSKPSVLHILRPLEETP
ncbi:hypothetical protein F0U83_12730 [Neptunomonas concharum]|uniref:DAGKc domain-containing protein n=2 Tax=Neptunomonas concharum TaxID=1031538 RepID=A0A5P1RDZ9_9GAMM|nr:hypothetical protein F0U83_12730 [Neptunomonas concharum]